MTTVVVQPKFQCEICNYSTSRRFQFDRHNSTRKHIMTTRGLHVFNEAYVCTCGKEFSCRQNLHRHKKICSLLPTNDEDNIIDEPIFSNNSHNQSLPPDMSIVLELLKQNQEFKDLVIEQTKQLFQQNQQNNILQEQLLEAIKDGKIGNTIHNNNNNTTNNNKFNLNFFLNETCQDAITMSDFINSIEVTLEDFIQTGNIGFVDGISKVMVERIKVMDLHTRPMHCTDLKRETLYIKNDTKWEKEDSDKTLLRKAVKNIANKNYNKLSVWYNNSKPAVEIIGSEDCENYFKYYKAALGGYDKEEDKKFEEKIIKNVLKEVLLDKVPT